MDRVAVVINKYSIGKSSPVLCILDLLSDNYTVDLYVKDSWYGKATVLQKENINFIPLESDYKNIIFKLWDRFRGNKDVPARAESCYKFFLCFDAHGFCLCRQLFPDSRPFYYSLELCFSDDHYNIYYPREVMAKERAEIEYIKGLIIQSEEREYLFRKEFDLPGSIPTFYLPVTYLQPSMKNGSSFLRQKYNIPHDKKIVLHLGGIQEYFSCIEMALIFGKLSDYVLVFHGYITGDYVDRLRGIIAKNRITNVFISDEVYELIEDMDPLIMSCDMGIAWYNDVSLNFSTAGKSSGKISAYLRFGLPVITKKYPSTIEAIENTGCGLCVENFEDIPAAVRKIESRYDYYSDNCRREYDKVYWFENYRAKLLEFFTL